MKLSHTIGLLLKTEDENRVLSVEPNQSVYEAIEKMAEYRVGAMLVISENPLAGVVSERDYARKVILKGHSSKKTPVSAIMSGPVVFVNPCHTLDQCMAIMAKDRFSSPSGGAGRHRSRRRMIGDLVKWIISRQAQTIQELEGYIAGAYPG